MNTYSFRAECMHDVEVLTALLPTMSIEDGDVAISPIVLGLPDVKVEVLTTAPLDTLKRAMGRVPDSHVMLETLRPCPLAQNSLERG